MDRNVASQVSAAIEGALKWTTVALPCKVYSSTAPDATEGVVDLVPLIQNKSSTMSSLRLKPSCVKRGKVYWLSPRLNENTGIGRHHHLRDELAPMFRAAGFRVIFTGKAHEAMNGRVSSHKIACSRGRLYEGSKCEKES